MLAKPLNEKAIFKAALNMESPEARSDFLHEVCGDDPAMLGRIAKLLQLNQDEPDFLEVPAARIEATVDDPAADAVGSQIGPYKIREQLGEGGMGIVYVAEQTEPVRRKVALKLIKPGRDTEHVIARFEAERQALAMMDHPNIARVLDAGATDAGLPYFVMELVRGLPITQFCDKAKLTTRQRLELFIAVCQAVQHAQQKGIIHRDIKPTNVLVTKHDGVPVVKVIDFGVAKALHETLGENSVYTGFDQMVGTPKFMSPEQAEMSGLDIDTRTDIYSLGVLLYCLLTGKTPLDSDDDAAKRSYDEMRRQIREVTPPKPSARFSTMKNADLSTIAECRHSDPQRLSRDLKGELDWIVMKALEKDRTRRYETAKAFAEDIRRHLNNQPVTAVAPSVWYLATKALKRHKVALATAASFLALLVVGAAVSTVMAVQASRAAAAESEARREAGDERDQAEGERKRAESERKKAEAARVHAESEREKALDLAYINDLNRAYQNARHADGNQQVTFDLLKWVPLEGETDRRGREWYLLNSVSMGAERFLHGHTTFVIDIAASPDGKRLASLDNQGMMVLWDVEAGEKIAAFQVDDREGTAVAWSSRGNHVATGGITGTIKLWTIGEDGRVAGEPRVLEKHSDRVGMLAFSPAGDQLVSGSGDQTCIVWQVDSGEAVSTFTGHKAGISSVNWHPDGTQIVSTDGREGEKGTARFWDPQTAAVVAPHLEGEPGPSWAVWQSEGELLATIEYACPRGEFTLRDGKTHEPVAVRTAQSHTFALWDNGSRYLATTHPWGGVAAVQVWDALAERPTRAFQGHTFGVGKTIWVDENRLATCSGDHTVRVWNLQPGDSRTFIQPDAITSAAWSPDGRLLALLSEGHAGVLSARDGSLLRRFAADRPFVAVAWAPDSRRLATWDLNEVALWDVDTGGQLSSFDTGASTINWSGDRSLQWQPNGDLLLTGVYGELKVWDTRTGTMVREFTDRLIKGRAQWNPAGDRIATSTPGGPPFTVVLDLPNAQTMRRTELAFGAIVAWSPDGNLLATSEDNGRIRDAQTGEEVMRMQGRSRGNVRAIAWHPDGSRVVTGSDLGTVRVWDAKSGRELLSFRELAEPVHWVGFSSDGTRLAAAGDAAEVKVWDATAGYVRSRSSWLLAALDYRVREGQADADDMVARARIHAAAGNWDQAATDFQRATGMLGDAAPKWFETAQWVIGSYPGNLQQAYPPEQQEEFKPLKHLPAVAGGPKLPTADELRW